MSDSEVLVNPEASTDPRPAPQTNSATSIPSPTVSTPIDSQATLLALLTQAANQQVPYVTLVYCLSSAEHLYTGKQL